MTDSTLFLLDTFVENNKLLIYFINEKGEKFFLYHLFKPVFYIKSSHSFIRNFSIKFKIPFFLCEKKEFFSGKTIQVYGIKVPLNRFYNIKNFLINQANINVYNTDLSPVLQFYFKYSLFPLAKVSITYENNRLLSIKINDNPFKTDYLLPSLTILSMSPVCSGNPKYSLWQGVEVAINGETLYFEEMDKIFFETIAELFTKNDPDFVITRCGDAIIIPLIHMIDKKYNIKIPLSRPFMKSKITKSNARTFFSYGKVVFRDSTTYLTGRIHIDILNSFFAKNSGIEGVIEVSRLTSLPLQDAARISPGSAISTMELKTAFNKNYLIPSTKAYPEKFKKAIELIKVDKGGLFYLPPVGSFSNVAEVDFFSMYPSIISKYNISVETLNCKCCKDIADNIKIPGTNYYFCQKKMGIIPETIEPIIEKRRKYKTINNEISSKRQSAIKWILVTCFGYLGYKNAKFGCVEAHEATTAMGREILLKAKEIAENNGFKVIYAVTDSLYLYKKDATKREYEQLVKKISLKTGFTLSLKGIYKFIKFLPSAENSKKQVMNKFFGILIDNKIKVRGLMLRKRDTPEYIKEFQKNILKNYFNIKEREKIYNEFLQKLQNREVNIELLSIKKRLTKKPSEYKKRSLSSVAANSLKNIQPGESIEYVVTDNKEKIYEHRAVLKQFAQCYDVDYYSDMLKKAYEEIIE